MQDGYQKVRPETETHEGIEIGHRTFVRVFDLKVLHFSATHHNPDGGDGEYAGEQEGTDDRDEYPPDIHRRYMEAVRVTEKRDSVGGHKKRVEYDA